MGDMTKPLNAYDELRQEARQLVEYWDFSPQQARIDELRAIYGWSQEERTPLIFYPEHRSSDFAQMAANGMGTNFTVRERIAELKEELEKL